MSYFETTFYKPADSAANDAFGRARVSNPTTIFDSQFTYSKQALLWEDITSGAGASVTHLPNESSVQMDVGTVSGEYTIRQTYEYHRYQPGKSQLVLLTGVMGAAKANVTQRIGYFDNDNGIFFEQDSTALSVVRRTSTAAGPGTPVDNEVIQSAWNLDTMDGSGPSGITLDMSKSQIFLIDIEWLGVGRVRCGFVVDGKIYYCHEFLNTNSLALVYMATPNLPLRYEIRNTGIAASGTSMKQICGCVMSEGGQENQHAFEFSIARSSAIAATTIECVVAIRPSQDFPNGSGVANRTRVLLESINAYATTNAAYLQLFYGATITGGAWASVGTNSSVEANITATAISGGTCVWSGFIEAATKSETALGQVIDNLLPFALDYAGTDQSRGWALACTAQTGTTNVAGSLNWREIH